MLNDTALVQACLLKIAAGAWDELQRDQVELLETEGLIKRFDIVLNKPLESPAQQIEYQLTPAGRDTLWPQ